MSEWWTELQTYSLSDFLMFSARTYYRQFELMQRELWPLPLLALTAGGFIAACMLRPRRGAQRLAQRLVYALLALAWAWVGWAYHLQRYADINTGAPWFAAGFFAQVGLLAWMASRRTAVPLEGGRGRAAVLAALLALAAYPLLAPLAGRGWWQAELFGMAPDPTALLTLGALLFWRAPWPLWAIPLLWCGISTATLGELRAPLAWLPLGAGAVLAAMRVGARRRAD